MPERTESAQEREQRGAREPGRQGEKSSLALTPDLRTDAAARRILQGLLDAMLANEVGIREDLDPEFLHDFRVAVRRTRSALGQIKRVFPMRTTERFRREFAWLGQITGPTRDLDVYLLNFEGYRGALPEALRSHLQPLRAFLERHRRSEHRALLRVLDGRRYRKLVQDWGRFLHSPLPRRPRAPNARRPVAEVASRRIRRTYRRAREQGGAITPESPSTDLHELRKTCKKLRYLMEFFGALYPEEPMKRLVKALKRLQDNLGELQDLEVQHESLTRFEALMAAEQALDTATRDAMEWLVRSLEERKHKVRKRFSREFERFTEPRLTRLFHTLFRADSEDRIGA